MRAGPAFRSSFFLFCTSSVFGLGCLLDASAFDTAGAGGTITTTTTTTTGTTTTTPMGGAGGATTTAGGGTGGMTTTSPGGGGTGGTGGSTGGGGTGGVPLPTSCTDALAMGVTQSGIVTIDPDTAELPEPAMDVYCDQTKLGGGWALVYSSIGDPAGQTTAFWNILYDQRLDVISPNGPASPSKNYYAGKLYRFGTEYRDDVVDTMNVEAIGVLHATASGINVDSMSFMQASKAADSLSADIYTAHFAAGWASPDHDADQEPDHNSAVYWANVTQHYKYDSFWRYNLGADKDPAMPGNPDPDYTDGGWGPHVLDTTIDEINVALLAKSLPTLSKDGAAASTASRVNRISRFARW